MAARRDPSIEAYTITFRPEDQRLEAMPDDAVYARKMAAHLGIRLHEIEISPDVVDMLPRIVDMLDEPIGDPAAINTVLMCQAARDAGVKVLLSGMGADEFFGGYRKHLACLLGRGIRRCRATSVAGWWRPASTGSPVAAGGRGLRYSRWAKRFLSFAELPEEAAFRRSYTLYDPDELPALLDPARPRSKPLWMPTAACTRTGAADHVNRMCLTDTVCSFPASTWPTPTVRACRRQPRCGFPSSTLVFTAAFSSRGSRRSRRTQKVALRRAAEDWVPRDCSTARRPRSGPRCGPG